MPQGLFPAIANYLNTINLQTIILYTPVIAVLFNLILAILTYQQAKLAKQSLEHSRLQHHLSMYPFIVQRIAKHLSQQSGGDIPLYRLENVGSGLALSVQIFIYRPAHPSADQPARDAWVWLRGGPCNIRAGGHEKELVDVPDDADLLSYREKELSQLAGDDVLAKARKEIVLITCRDQFGTWHRFRLGHVPERWNSAQKYKWNPWRHAERGWEPWPRTEQTDG